MGLENLITFRDSSLVLSVLRDCGGVSRFVGGCVRNSIISAAVSDIDIATTLLPDQVESAFHRSGIKTIDIGKDHGTIIGVVNGYPYEITTLRKDISTDGRRAVVAFSDSWQEDALRRDFTINAMSYCPYEKKLYDYFCGKQDLHSGIIKFVGVAEDRVKEDYLRILRLFRFYTYYGKSIDIPSLKACVNHACHLDRISAERKYHELKKILGHQKYFFSIEIMMNKGVLDSIFGASISPEILVLFKDLDEFKYQPLSSYLFKLFVIMYKSNVTLKELDLVLKFSNKDKNYFKDMFQIVISAPSKIESDIYELIYKNKNLFDSILFLVLDKKITNLSLLEEVLHYNSIKLRLPLDGEDIKRRFFINAGKDVGRLLKMALNYWCKSKYSATKDNILDYLDCAR
jgi:poly(A) polymerase